MTQGKQGAESFENSLERLENIVEQMEAGNLGLEDMVARFEEGQKLIRQCSKKLTEVERRIEKLVKKGDETVCVPLDEETEENPPVRSAAPAAEPEDDAPF